MGYTGRSNGPNYLSADKKTSAEYAVGQGRGDALLHSTGKWLCGMEDDIFTVGERKK